MDIVSKTFLADWHESMAAAREALVEDGEGYNETIIVHNTVLMMVDKGWTRSGIEKEDNFDEYVDRVCRFFGVDRRCVFDHHKQKTAVFCRTFIIKYLRDKYPAMSLAEIGEKLGGFNHSTVIAALERYDELAKRWPELVV